MRQLKQEKIFGFGSYDEFIGEYFQKDLVAVEDINRLRKIQNARKKYEMRWKVSDQQNRMRRQREAQAEITKSRKNMQIRDIEQRAYNEKMLQKGLGLN